VVEKKKNYCKTSEAAKLLGVAVSTIQLWANNGSLRAWTTDGGHRRIERTSVEEMLAKQQPNDTNLLSGIPAIPSHSFQKHSKENLIYLALSLGEPRLKKDLLATIKESHYQVKSFTAISEIKVACEKELPTAIIIDMAFNDGEVVGLDAIAQLKNNIDSCPTLLFISGYDQPEFRLAAVRAGADYYFCKPVRMNKFTRVLNSLKTKVIQDVNPFRVLIVDDDVSILNLYSTVLKKAGMEVETVSNPLDALSILPKFKPDVIVVDVFMPECSGSELIRMIRQDEKGALISFIFLSGKNDINSQLEAIELGAEDFLSKPVKNNQLVLIITATAKRARNNVQLNKDLKNALRENKFQLITLNQHVLVSTSDVSGRITQVNKKFCEISGYSVEELIGQDHRILKSECHPDSFYFDMWDTISSGNIWHGTVCNRKKNNEEYWVESTIVPFLDDKGKPYKYVAMRTDITALRQSEERLEQSQKFAHISTLDWDILNDCFHCSDSLWELFGFSHKTSQPTYDYLMSAIHPDDKPHVEKAVNNSVEQSIGYDIEYRVIWPDTSVHWLHAQGDVVRDKKGMAVRLLGIVRDITEEREDKQNLIDARIEAEAASEAKSQFLSSMSHELRTPMNAIIGFSQLLKMETKNPLALIQQEHVNEILVAGTHLMALIDEVLDLSNIEAGNIEVILEDVFLAKLVTNSLQLIMPLAQRRNIEINLRVNNADISYEDLLQENIFVKADPSRLKQVLINLLSNAVKYNSENGNITLSCDHVDNNKFRISVTDTGNGLTVKQQSQLFTSFNRLGAEQGDIEGTGIGLVISKNIIKLMDGDIGVACQPGKGCTFWLDIPIGKEVFLDEKKDNANIIQSIKNSEEKNTVLYIEDNPTNLKLVSNLLMRLPSMTVLEAHEPVLGIDLAIEHKPDLILLDINLPGMNGFEVLKQLKQKNITNGIPIIAVSANAMPVDINKALEAGFDDYITKPIDVTAFLLVVDKILTRNKAAGF
jgi:PAS domain S-box-containing protein/excisionase family DNA binding protein